jgi:hypothetical protein
LFSKAANTADQKTGHRTVRRRRRFLLRPEPFLDQIDSLLVMSSRHSIDPRCAGRCALLSFRDAIPGQTQMLTSGFTFDRRSIHIYFNVVTGRIAKLDVEVY